MLRKCSWACKLSRATRTPYSHPGWPYTICSFPELRFRRQIRFFVNHQTNQIRQDWKNWKILRQRNHTKEKVICVVWLELPMKLKCNPDILNYTFHIFPTVVTAQSYSTFKTQMWCHFKIWHLPSQCAHSPIAMVFFSPCSASSADFLHVSFVFSATLTLALMVYLLIKNRRIEAMDLNLSGHLSSPQWVLYEEPHSSCQHEWRLDKRKALDFWLEAMCRCFSFWTGHCDVSVVSL